MSRLEISAKNVSHFAKGLAAVALLTSALAVETARSGAGDPSNGFAQPVKLTSDEVLALDAATYLNGEDRVSIAYGTYDGRSGNSVKLLSPNDRGSFDQIFQDKLPLPDGVENGIITRVQVTDLDPNYPDIVVNRNFNYYYNPGDDLVKLPAEIGLYFNQGDGRSFEKKTLQLDSPLALSFEVVTTSEYEKLLTVIEVAEGNAADTYLRRFRIGRDRSITDLGRQFMAFATGLSSLDLNFTVDRRDELITSQYTLERKPNGEHVLNTLLETFRVQAGGELEFMGQHIIENCDWSGVAVKSDLNNNGRNDLSIACGLYRDSEDNIVSNTVLLEPDNNGQLQEVANFEGNNRETNVVFGSGHITSDTRQDILSLCMDYTPGEDWPEFNYCWKPGQQSGSFANAYNLTNKFYSEHANRVINVDGVGGDDILIGFPQLEEYYGGANPYVPGLYLYLQEGAPNRIYLPYSRRLFYQK